MQTEPATVTDRIFSGATGTLLLVASAMAAYAANPGSSLYWLATAGCFLLGAEELVAAWFAKRSLLVRVGPLP